MGSVGDHGRPRLTGRTVTTESLVDRPPGKDQETGRTSDSHPHSPRPIPGETEPKVRNVVSLTEVTTGCVETSVCPVYLGLLRHCPVSERTHNTRRVVPRYPVALPRRTGHDRRPHLRPLTHPPTDKRRTSKQSRVRTVCLEKIILSL